jgi:ubiquinone/menaquinone biosynthesis C-methylase UbiE
MGLGVKRLLWRGLMRCFPVRARKHSVRTTYDQLAALEDDRAGFLNEGYAPLDPGEPVPALEPEDRPLQYHANLYHHVACQVDLRGAAVLEVGCGRGGGCHFLHRYLGPARVTGLDLSERNVRVATRVLARPGLAFRQGDAEALPFAPGSFDAVVNIESSHLYPRPEVFFAEAHRVLRSGGHLLFVDLGERARMDRLAGQFRQAGFEVVSARDITRNVVESIQADNERRGQIIRAYARNERHFRELAAWARMVGTPGYEAYLDGREAYWSYVLRKP